MNEILALVTGLFNSLKLPLKWVMFIIVVVLSILGILGYEQFTSHYYINKLEKKIEMLGKLQEIADDGFEHNTELEAIYIETSDELRQLEITKVSLFKTPIILLNNPVKIGKAISGSFLWIIMMVYGLITESQKAGKITGSVMLVVIVIGLVAWLFAWLASLIPTIYKPWVNYIGFPLIQFWIIYSLGKKKKK